MASEVGGRAIITESTHKLLRGHSKKHFTTGEVVRDVIIGVSDCLMMPFPLAAGLSGANASSSIILTAGLAEVAAGAISMGLCGTLIVSLSQQSYLAVKSEADNYQMELKREQEEILNVPDTVSKCGLKMGSLLYQQNMELLGAAREEETLKIAKITEVFDILDVKCLWQHHPAQKNFRIRRLWTVLPQMMSKM